ncbi:MAG TPA: HAD family phosphatase [Acetobacteraceae bacterium]
MQVAAVVLDLDGTLLDTERVYQHAFMVACGELGFSTPTGLYGDLVGLPSTERGALLRRHFGVQFPWQDFLDRYYACRNRMLAGDLPIGAGAIELLDWLDARAIPKAVATSASRSTAETHLMHAGLRDRFGVLVTRDDVSFSKPHPESFLKAAMALGVAPRRCVGIEDSAPGLSAAIAAGMAVIAVGGQQDPRRFRPMLGVARDLHHVRALLARAIEPALSCNVQPAA